MCGIAGYIDYDKDVSQERYLLEQMTQKLSRRGPDAGAFYFSRHAAIAHRRLIVVDPIGGGQPMSRKKGEHSVIITYNGELYNTADLRSELEASGYAFTSNSDTEVLITSYMEWGTECPKHLNGIFAFAVWDESTHSLFMARDRFGVKPLFYTIRNNALIFASELKALLVHPLAKNEIAADGLAEIFGLGPARTPGHGIFKNILEVKPAESILFSRDGVRQKPYWSLESYEHPDNLEQTVATVRSLVNDAIERQLVSDVPLCTFLSGGLDSSAISAIAAESYRRRNRAPLDTYSIDYTDNELHFKPSAYQPTPDAPWVKRMSEYIHSNHHSVVLDNSLLASSLEDAVSAKDLPGMADIDSSLWLFCREVKNNATVALSGECADEIFGGYPWFHRAELMDAGTFPWSRFIEERTAILSPETIDYCKPADYVQQRYYETLEAVPRLTGESSLDARRREIFYLNIVWFMQTLLDRKDRMSMAHGLEVRVPFCDHRLVQYVWNIPWEIKSIDGMSKGILRRALKEILPKDVLERKKSPYPKTHHPAYEAALKRRLKDILDEGSSKLLPLINVPYMRSLLDTKSDYGRPWFGQLMAQPQLFAYLIQIDFWLKEYRVEIV